MENHQRPGLAGALVVLTSDNVLTSDEKAAQKNKMTR